jgi:hypothetical protein
MMATIKNTKPASSAIKYLGEKMILYVSLVCILIVAPLWCGVKTKSSKVEKTL